MKKLQRLMIAAATAGAAMTATVPAFGGTADSTFSYVPKVHGDVRPRWEIETQDGNQNFQVKNAVLSITGQVAPWATYFVYGDLCNQGKIVMLDAWGEVGERGWSVRVGQFRMPFGVDVGRGPHSYYFADRSFMGKQMCNFRAVGVRGAWSRSGFPLSIEAGVFNPAPITNHLRWDRSVAWSAKATLALGDWKVYGGFMSVTPYGVRADMVDATLSWSRDRWIVEAEYIYEHYHNGYYHPAHGYMAFANYAMPIRLQWFNKLSFQGRFDGMTNHASLQPGDDGATGEIDPARNRITVGTTLSYVHSATISLDLRLNYEQYFYHHGVEGPRGERNKIVAELAFHF